MDNDICLCALSRLFGFKPVLCRELASDKERMKELFSLSKNELSALFPDEPVVAESIANGSALEWSNNELEWARKNGISIITIGDTLYPKLLAECPDAPIILFYLGSDILKQERKISIVGTRLSSYRCNEECADIIEGIAGYNPVIVSGLAVGIDTCAHKSAIAEDLATIAVLPTGLDRIYPSQNMDLAKKILKHGGLLTEFPKGTPPAKPFFIRRNRIIAGLSAWMIVVETRARGGSIMTVKYANSYDREVYAVPGRISDPNSYGCNYLISRNMASIFTGIEDFIRNAGWNDKCRRVNQPDLFSSKGEEKSKIFLTLKDKSPLDAESICMLTGLKYTTVAQVLLDMELEGEIERADGFRYKIVKNGIH